MKSPRLKFVLSLIMVTLLLTGRLCPLAWPQTSQSLTAALLDSPQRDGSHDFDFLIGDWKAHVRRLPDRLVGSNTWIEYDGISNHKKILDSNANFEEFDVRNPEKNLRIKAQTLRLYNPQSHQWSIYLVDVDNGHAQSSSGCWTVRCEPR